MCDSSVDHNHPHSPKREKKNNQTPTHTKPPTEKQKETHTPIGNKQTHEHTQGFKHFCEITHEACEFEYIITVHSVLGWNV